MFMLLELHHLHPCTDSVENIRQLCYQTGKMVLICFTSNQQQYKKELENIFLGGGWNRNECSLLSGL